MRRNKAKKRLSHASLGLVLAGVVFVLAYPFVAVDRHRGASSVVVVKRTMGAFSAEGANFSVASKVVVSSDLEDDDHISTTLVREVVSESNKTHTDAVVSAKKYKRRKHRKKKKKVQTSKKSNEKANPEEEKTTKKKKHNMKKKKNPNTNVSKDDTPTTTVKLPKLKKKKETPPRHPLVDIPTTYASYVNVSLPLKPKNVKYIRSRHDRAGSVIWDMLKAHAFLFQRGDELGGSCGHNHWHAEVEGLLRTVGLQQVLRYNCPSGMDEFTKQEKKHFISRSKYRHDEDHTFTPEWMEYMKQVVPHPKANQSFTTNDKKVLTVAMHIRRGDVSLCTGNAKRRYLPNSHYLRLMDRLVEQHPNLTINVTIYSESPLHYSTRKGTQYEDWSVFVDRNYTLNLDGNIQQVWRDFIDADILITSMSGFSLTPALLRLDRPGVIFTPHQNAYMLPHWQLVPETDMQRMAEEMRQMQIERCPLKGQEVEFFDDPTRDYERHYYTNAAETKAAAQTTSASRR